MNSSMKRKISFASIGDLCIDVYLQKKKFFVGGTAFNAAVHAKRAGAKPSIFSAVGTDDYGELFLTALQKHKIDSSSISVLDGETSSLSVTTAKDGHRTFSEWRLGVLEKYRLLPTDHKKLQEYRIARMTLFKPLTKLFDSFAQLQLPDTVKVADFAGSSQYSEGTSLVEKYSKNFDIFVKSVDDQSDVSYFRQLSITYKNNLYIVLRGNKGSIAFSQGNAYEQSAIQTKVTDTNGAGDSYVANFLVTYLETKDIARAMLAGSKAATQTIRDYGAVV